MNWSDPRELRHAMERGMSGMKFVMLPQTTTRPRISPLVLKQIAAEPPRRITVSLGDLYAKMRRDQRP